MAIVASLKGLTAVRYLEAKHNPVLGRYSHVQRPIVKYAEGSWYWLTNGVRKFDAAGGPAVTCIGLRDMRVIDAMKQQQLTGVNYAYGFSLATDVGQRLRQELRDGTGGLLTAMYICNSGTEANEAAMKLGRQFFVEQGQEQRTIFIGRKQSYHGSSAAGLAIGGFLSRRAIYEPILPASCTHVSACSEYRGKHANESKVDYVQRLVDELRDEFLRVGSENVIAFVVEPVVGAALGCASALAGYLKGVQAVCHEYGALLILDEVMCGMGRCGTLHAWQKHGIVPDIETIGKGLGGGYMPVGAVLASAYVHDVIKKGSGQFAHGQTYQEHPLACQAALTVQTIIREDNLLQNVNRMGARLEARLRHRLQDHPNVGDIRGDGLFWGIEFVNDKSTKEPFHPDLKIAYTIFLKAFYEHDIFVYFGTGSAYDGYAGDHLILAPAFNITAGDVDLIVERTSAAIEGFFTELKEADFDPDTEIRARL